MDSVKFQPIYVSDNVLSRPLTDELIQDPRVLTVLNAPRGFGKSTLAAQVYEQWPDARLWVNMSQWSHGNAGLVKFLNDLAKRLSQQTLQQGLGIRQSLPPAEAAHFLVELLNSSQQNRLLVIDDLEVNEHHDFLAALLSVIALVAPGHKIIICTQSPLLNNRMLLANSHCCRLVYAHNLRLAPTEVASIVPANWRHESTKMQLLKECEGWPALVGIVMRELNCGVSESDLKLMLIDFVVESMAHYLPETALDCATALADLDEFDDSLFQAFEVATADNIRLLIDAGFLQKSERLSLNVNYRWSSLVQQVAQRESHIREDKQFTCLRMLAWADDHHRWADGLFLALKLDDTNQIRKRLITTGRRVQESGHARLLRQALYFIKWDQEMPVEDYMELVFIDLAAHCMQPKELLTKKIAQSYQYIKALPEVEQGRYLTWIKCVEAQFAMRNFDPNRAKILLDEIQNTIGLLPTYYQVQALSIMGEVALNEGFLGKALSYFERGADLSDVENLTSSVLWHRHQQAQVHSLAGQSSVAEHIRFSAIQLARESKGTRLFPYHCLLRAHCESLLSELRIHEAEPYLAELEQQYLFNNDEDSLAVNLLRLDCHRLTCLLDSDYQSDIQPTVFAIERALLGAHQPHVAVRAQRSLLNYWFQSEQIYQVAQWYQRQSLLEPTVNDPNQLMHVRNVFYAFLILQSYDYDVPPIWPNYTQNDANQWLVKWPGIAPSPLYLRILTLDEVAPDVFAEQLSKAMGCFSQTNALAEPLAYHPSWLEPLHRGDVPLHRYQATFVSRLNAIRGNRVKYRIVRDAQSQTSSIAHIGLSPREWQLLQCVSRGQTNDYISEQLNLSVGTVKNQLTKIYRKLGVTNRTAARSRFKSLAETA